jgi:Ca2+-binding EF-hand superfamily protein
MFDLNGDGDVDAEEFEVVTNLMKSQSNFGAKHRDHGNTGSSYKGINSGLITYFFGENKEGNLTVDKFLEFQRQLQNEILRLEFNRKSSGSNTIPEKAFAELLIAYAGFPDKKKSKMIRRVRRTFKDSDRGVTLEDYLNFYQVLNNINDIDTALQFYHIAGAPIERSTMKHVAHTVAGVDLSEHIVDVVFVLFDNDGDGKLSNKEFVSVMKQRAMRGLEKPKDTGIAKICSAMTKCASDLKPSLLRKD